MASVSLSSAAASSAAQSASTSSSMADPGLAPAAAAAARSLERALCAAFFSRSRCFFATAAASAAATAAAAASASALSLASSSALAPAFLRSGLLGGSRSARVLHLLLAGLDPRVLLVRQLDEGAEPLALVLLAGLAELGVVPLEPSVRGGGVRVESSGGGSGGFGKERKRVRIFSPPPPPPRSPNSNTKKKEKKEKKEKKKTRISINSPLLLPRLGPLDVLFVLVRELAPRLEREPEVVEPVDLVPGRVGVSQVLERRRRLPGPQTTSPGDGRPGRKWCRSSLRRPGRRSPRPRCRRTSRWSRTPCGGPGRKESRTPPAPALILPLPRPGRSCLLSLLPPPALASSSFSRCLAADATLSGWCSRAARLYASRICLSVASSGRSAARVIRRGRFSFSLFCPSCRPFSIWASSPVGERCCPRRRWCCRLRRKRRRKGRGGAWRKGRRRRSRRFRFRRCRRLREGKIFF